MSSYLKESSVFANAIKELDGKSLGFGARRPDGDCIGSQVALTRVLQELELIQERLIRFCS